MKTSFLFILIATIGTIPFFRNVPGSSFSKTSSLYLPNQEGDVIPRPDVKDKFFEIKYEELLKQSNRFKLGDIASDIKYIKLETKEECLIGPMAKYYFCDSLIFVNNRSSVLKFSSDGKFLKRFGRQGRGPGEVNYLKEVSLIPGKRILVIHDSGARKLLYFSFDGNLIKSVPVSYVSCIKVMNDGNYIGMDRTYARSENSYFFLANEKGDTLDFLANNNKWKNPSGVPMTFSMPSYEPFYSFQNNYFSKTIYNDTVYVVNSNKLKPSYFINLGKFKLPEEKRIERLNEKDAQTFREVSADYYLVNTFETRGRIFLSAYSFGRGPDKYFLINKNSFLNGSKQPYNEASIGLLMNDYDGGINFWPTGPVNDNQVFMSVEIIKIKKLLETSGSGKVPVKYPEKQKQLENLISGLDIAGNPVLMVVTLKPGV